MMKLPLFAVGLVTIAMLSQAQSLSSGGPIGPSSGSSTGAQVLLTPTRVHVLFSYAAQAGAAQQLFITSSSNGGSSFGNSRQVSATAASSTSLAAALGPKTGTLYIVWAEVDYQAQTSSILFARSTDLDQGNSFTAPLRVSNAGLALAPRIAVDNNETIYVVWESGGSSVNQRQVFFAKSPDQGASFSPEKTLSDIGSFSTPNVVAANSSLFVIWKNQQQQPASVAATRSTDRGDTFSAPAAVPNTTTLAVPTGNGLPAVSLAPSSAAFAFQNTSVFPGSIWVVRADASTGTYQTPVALDGVTGVVAPPALIAVPQSPTAQSAAVAWLGNYTSNGNGYFGLLLSCADDSGGFHDPRPIAPLSTASTGVSAAADNSGFVHVVAIQPAGQESRMLYFQGVCPPRFSVASVVNAASQQAPGVVPGSIASLYGSQLGPAAGSQVGALDPQTGLLLSSAGGVTVTFGGVPAPLFYIRRDQINFQVPVEVAGQSSAQVVVAYNGVSSLPVQVPVASVGPSFFTLDGSGSGAVVAANQDGSVNGPGTPAAKGSVVVLYLTGHGLTVPALKTGQPSPLAPPFPQPGATLGVSIDGKPADLQFVGAAPGFAGLLQVNATVPTSASSGPVDIKASMGSFTSRAGTTLSVR